MHLESLRRKANTHRIRTTSHMDTYPFIHTCVCVHVLFVFLFKPQEVQMGARGLELAPQDAQSLQVLALTQASQSAANHRRLDDNLARGNPSNG